MTRLGVLSDGPPAIARDAWEAHPHYPSQVLLRNPRFLPSRA